MLFYTGNEEDIEEFYNNSGFVFELAESFKALVVFAEHVSKDGLYYGGREMHSVFALSDFRKRIPKMDSLSKRIPKMDWWPRDAFRIRIIRFSKTDSLSKRIPKMDSPSKRIPNMDWTSKLIPKMDWASGKHRKRERQKWKAGTETGVVSH